VAAVSALTDCLEACGIARPRNTDHTGRVVLESGAVHEGYRLSPQQQRLWNLLGRGDPNGCIAQCTAIIHGPLDPSLLRQALTAVAGREEILRTTFHTVPQMTFPVQVIADAPEIGFDHIRLADSVDEPTACDRLLEAARQQPFDLAAGPLLRATLATLDDHRHALAITASALCADAASLSLLLRLTARRYRGDRLDHAPDAPLQYADLAEWLNELVESQETESGRAYWRRLAAASAATVVKGDSFVGVRPPRSGVQSAGSVTIRVGASAVAALDGIAVACEVSPAIILLTCWRLVLSGLVGDQAVTVGVRCAGRDSDDLREALGPLERVVPIEFPDAARWGTQTFRDLARAVRDAAAEAAQWQPYFSWGYFGPAAGLNVGDGPGAWPAEFDYDSAEPEPLGPETALMVGAQSVAGDGAGLRFSCLRRPADLLATILYDAEVVDRAVAGRLLDRLVDLIARIGELMDRPVRSIELAPPQERAQVLRLGTGDFADPGTTSLHELFEAQVARSPDRTALVCGTRQLTFAQLDRRASNLAAELRHRGVGPEALVGLCLPVSTDLIAAILGIWKAGGAYLPLAVDGPPERHARMVHDAGARLIVTESAVAPRLLGTAATLFCLDQTLLADQSDVDGVARLRVSPRQLAYAIYTSGSTGGPKGVMIEHRSVALLWTAMRRAVHGHDSAGQPRQVALNAALTFDASIQQLVMLFDGHTLHLLPDKVRRDDEALVRYVRKAEVDVLNGTPTQIAALLAAGLLAEGGHVPGNVLIAGEAVSESLWSALRIAPARAHNIYGPTECTVNATATAIAAAGQAPVIGRPLPGYQVLVLDQRLHPLPFGAVGEIFIGGPAVARGYVGQPGLTAERFVPHPLASTPGERLYRTGDLGRLREDGQLEFLGRRDSQLKLRGFRIEPGEIEGSLRAHPGIRDAVLVADDQPEGRRLVAYFIPADDVPPSLAELRAFLAERLPDYMIPSVFVPLGAFPRTVNGKLDRRSLPAPDSASRAGSGAAYVLPRTPVEATLAAIWAKALGVSEVGIDDNFFALGGDSIRAIRLRAQAGERGLSFSISELFGHQTIRDLAAVVRTGRGADAATQHPSETTDAAGSLTESFALLDEADREKLSDGVVDAYPLTGTQAGMVYRSEYNAGEALFCNVRTVHLRGQLDTDVLRAALAQLTAAHPALRTSLDLVTFSEPMQLVWASAQVPLSVDDISDLTSAAQDQAVTAFCAAEQAAGFCWTQPPFVRFAVHWRGPETFQVTITMHETVLDGWSVATLLTELVARYRAILGQGPAVAAPPATLHRAAVAAELRAKSDPAQATFWERYLTGTPERSLPVWPAEPGGGAPGHAHHVLAVRVPAATADGLRELAARTQLPLKSVLLAAHLYVMGRLGGSACALTGLVTHGRPAVPDGDRALGQFLNVLPLRATLRGSWTDLARQAFAAEAELLPFRNYPAAYVRGPGGRVPSVDAVFNFTHFHVYDGINGAGWDRISDDFSERTDLTLLTDFSVDPTTAEIGLTLNCNGMSAHQSAAAARLYADCLDAMATDPDGTVAAHRRAAAFSSAPSASCAPSGETVTSLFAEQARRRPHATAVSSAAGSLTYAEVDERAENLARLLTSVGVGPDTLVGVAVGRSPELLIAMIAIFKAGGAYFPIDSGAPPSYVATLMARGGTRLVLTDNVHSSSIDAACAAAGADLTVMVLPLVGERPAPPARLAAPTRSPQGGTHPAQLAYAIGTSGSSGEPKVALITQAGLVNHLKSKVESLKLGPADRVAQIAPATFDVSVWQFLAALLAGGEVAVIPDEDVADPQRLLPALAERAVTVAALVPSMLQAALGTGEPPSLPALGCLLSTGEPLTPALAERWLSTYPHTRLVNAYGPTECADNVSQQDIAPDSGSCPVGQPIRGVRIYLLDQELAPVPAGIPGQLCVAGPCLARGYAADTARTAASFVPDPFVPGERMYLTGDRAYQRPDGALEYLGRFDRQVKINGVRIEPAAVEAVLGGHPAVMAAFVRADAGPSGTTRLTAYLVCGDPPPESRELSAYLSERLPASLVPTRYVYLAGLPIGANGKVEEAALAAQTSLGQPAKSPAAGREPTETERALLRLWTGVLGEPPPSLEHSFFDVGGESIRATQLLARIRREFNAGLSLRSMVARPTVAGLAMLLSETDPRQPG
jgi:amino acid adenylation domain-containing protein